MTTPYRGAGLGVEVRRVRFVRPRFLWPIACATLIGGLVASWLPFSGYVADPSFQVRAKFAGLGMFVALASLAALFATVRSVRGRADLVFYERGFEIARGKEIAAILYRDVSGIELHGVSPGTPAPSGAFTYVLSMAHDEPVIISSDDYADIDADFGDWLVERTGRPIR